MLLAHRHPAVCSALELAMWGACLSIIRAEPIWWLHSRRVYAFPLTSSSSVHGRERVASGSFLVGELALARLLFLAGAVDLGEAPASAVELGGQHSPLLGLGLLGALRNGDGLQAVGLPRVATLRLRLSVLLRPRAPRASVRWGARECACTSSRSNGRAARARRPTLFLERLPMVEDTCRPDDSRHAERPPQTMP